MPRNNPSRFPPLHERGPLRVMFLITSMPVGGAETLLVNLVRRMDRSRFEPQIGCLKEPGPLGAMISEELPVHTHLIAHKFDLSIVNRLRRLFDDQQIDAVVTVGAGDKMFWGRLAARRARIPVILSALHSTGWPDGVGRLNRMLTRITDGFIAVAGRHGDYLVNHEGFPRDKVFVIPNGVDTNFFVHDPEYRQAIRDELDVASDAPVVVIVAALRPEKNHELFLKAARHVHRQNPDACFLVVGEGPQRDELVRMASDMGIARSTRFTGARSDVPALLSASDLFVLTSRNEASPVSILEAMSCGLPVVAPNVGSISETLIDGTTGILFEGEEPRMISELWLQVLGDDRLRTQMGIEARTRVEQNGSLQSMTDGYESLLESIYAEKTGTPDGLPVTLESTPESTIHA